MMRRITNKHIENFTKLESFFYRRPLFKVPIFVGSIVILLFVISSLGVGEWVSYASFFLVFAIDLYLLFFIVFLLRHSFKSLLTASNMGRLILSYIMFILSILLLFSFGYRSIQDMDRGYLTYGRCSDNFDPSMISADEYRSTDYFYFSSVTLFTVGYGDICPMGWSKGLALINSFAGNFISVVLMVVVISAYVNRSQMKK